MRKKRQNKYLWLLLVLLAVSIGYAALSTTLKINGSALLNKNTWSVYWRNAVVTEGSVSQTPPTIGEDQGDPEDTKVTFGVNLDLPGDFYEFTVEAVNNGTVDAMILDMTPSSTPALPDYIKYTIVYDDDDEPLEQFHALRKAKNGNPTVEKYRIRVEYTDDITAAEMNAIDPNGDSYTFTYEVDYSQADDRAIDKVSQPCPGKNCIYAFYNGSPNGTPDIGYNIGIGDVLPLGFATASGHGTENYFGGPTSNYKELKLEYDEYVVTSEFHGQTFHTYYNSLYECQGNIYNNCQYYKRESYQPPLFYGHIIDGDRKVIQKFTCIEFNNKPYCFDNFKIYGNNRDAGYAAYNVFSMAFGEYDSSTGKGCRIFNEDNVETFKINCNNSDGKNNIDLQYSYQDLVVHTENIATKIRINQDTDCITGPTNYSN